MKNHAYVLAAAAAFALGVAGFLAVPGAGGAPLGVLPAVYYALGLFVLNPAPCGLPSGGPPWAVAALWMAHFLAPLSLASFLVEALLSLVRGRERSYRHRQGHAIVCGLGRTALLCVEEIVAKGSAGDVVVVELFPDCPLLPRVREMGVPVVTGSMTEEPILRRAGIEHARRFLALANDDILNINAATAARGLNRERELYAVAQVSDAKLHENLPASLKRDVTFLNIYEIAADALVRTKQLTHGYEDAYVIAGFGNFGQMMLKALLREEGSARQDRFFVLDRDAEEKVRMFQETFGFEDRDVRPVRGNLHDPAMWQGLRDAMKKEPGHGRDPIVLVCTDNDVSNLSLALSIRRRYVKESTIFCRMFGDVSFEAEMVKGHNIETYRVADLLRKNLPHQVLGARHG